MKKIFAMENYVKRMGIRELWQQVKDERKVGTLTICCDCLRLKTPHGWIELDAETRLKVIEKAYIAESHLCPVCADNRQRIKRLLAAAENCSACGDY